MAVQQCLIIIKPDGLIKSLTGNIITKLSEASLKIVGAKVISVSRELAEKHYADWKERKKEVIAKEPEVFENLINYITGKYHTNRVFALVYQGDDAINKIREICGATNPEKAHPTSIRGKYGRINSETKVWENVVHASESEKEAEREIKLWFSPGELVETTYPTSVQKAEVERLAWK
jgi:nucleoside-diphosphate kinase